MVDLKIFKCEDCSHIGPAVKKMHGAWYMLLPVWFIGLIISISVPWLGIPLLIGLYFQLRKDHCLSCGSMNVKRYFTEEELNSMNKEKEAEELRKMEEKRTIEMEKKNKEMLELDFKDGLNEFKRLKIKIIGGSGWGDMIDHQVDLRIMDESMDFFDFSLVQKKSVLYRDIRAVEIGGPGTVTSGPGISGGGFGAEGALTGMAIATVANILLTHSSTRTIVRILFDDSEVIFISSYFEPDAIRVVLSPLFVGLKSLNNEGGEKSMSKQLIELVGLRDSGVLSEEQYQKAVNKVVS